MAGSGIHLHRAASRRVGHRVFQEIRQNGAKQHGVSVGLRPGRRLNDEVQLTLRGLGLERLAHLPNQCPHLHALAPHRQSPALAPRQGQQPREDGLQMQGDRQSRRVCIGSPGFRRLDGQLRQAPQLGHRGAELVRHVRAEPPLALEGVLQPGKQLVEARGDGCQLSRQTTGAETRRQAGGVNPRGLRRQGLQRFKLPPQHARHHERGGREQQQSAARQHDLQRGQGAIQLPAIGGHDQDRLWNRTVLRLVVRIQRTKLQARRAAPSAFGQRQVPKHGPLQCSVTARQGRAPERA